MHEEIEEFNPYGLDFMDFEGEQEKEIFSEDDITPSSPRKREYTDEEDNIIAYINECENVTGRDERMKEYHRLKGEYRRSLHNRRPKLFQTTKNHSSITQPA